MSRHRPRPLETRPSVSVVIPCYNYGRYLPGAVASALDQDALDVDVLIVDDASTDDSADVAEHLASGDERVNLLVHDSNQGHIATYNDGLAKVGGDYVVLLSADDLLPRNALTRAVALMEHHPSVGLVYGFPENFLDTPPSTSERVRSWSVWQGEAWLSRLATRGGNVIMSPEVVMRREAWDQLGGYDPRLPHAADLAAWLNTALRWDIGRVNGPTQAFYRVHDANMHLTQYAGMLTDLKQRALVFDLLFTEGQPLPGDSGRLRHDARQAIARTAVRLAAEIDDSSQDRQEFLEFAQARWPGILATRAWRRAGNPRAGRMARKASAPGRRVAAAVAWHRWRRYGL